MSVSSRSVFEITGRHKIIDFIKSLRARIFIVVFFAGIISCEVMRVNILENYENRAIDVRTSEVSTQMKILANHLITYNYLSDTSSEVINAELELLANLYDGRVMVINDNLQIVKDTYNISAGKTIISEEVVSCLKSGTAGATSKYDSQNGYIEMTTPITQTQSLEDGDVLNNTSTVDVVKGVLLISVSTDYIGNTLSILSRRALTIEIILIIVIFVFAIWASNQLLVPFEKITKAINDMKSGYSDKPIQASHYTETEHIVDAFNQLQARMKTLDDSRNEFVSNVSHELKTPITSMKVLAGSLLAEENIPNEVYREFMVDIDQEIDREDKIINDLLALVKMDKKSTDLNITSVDIEQMTEVIMKRLRPIARKQNIDLTLESRRQITAEVDEVKLSLVIMNLVENAIKYNKDGGWVKVILDADHQFFTVTVSDSGMGIPQESIEHIYERFYRVDKSRSREIGGTGLGLAIARSAILMHRGSINVESELDKGTTFTVRIPLTYVVNDNQAKK